MQEGCLLYGGRSFYYVTGIIASLLINALFTGIAIDLMLSHGQNENNMKEITGVINE